MTQTLAALRNLGSPRLHPNHCTGARAIFQLNEGFPGRVLQTSAGMRWDFS
jgi:metal-dependent hydrolase (beta-lactamase superfamily II)